MRFTLLWLIACLVGCGTTTPKTEPTPPPSLETPMVETNEAGSEELAPPPGEPRIDASMEADRLSREGVADIQAYAFSEGVRKLKESLVFSADQPEVRQVLISVFLRMGRAMDALNVSEEWIRSSPDDRVAVQFRVRVLMQADRLRPARDVVQRYLLNHADDLEIRNLLARVLIMMGLHEQAIQESTKVLKADQVNVEAMTNVARTYLAQGKADLAKFVIGQALGVTETATLYHMLSQVFIGTKDWQKAEAYLRKATELDADFPEAFNNLGVVYQRVGDYPSAVVALEQAVRVAPGYRDGYLNLGNAYRGLKEYTKAKGAYEVALTLDDRYAAAYFNLGILFFENQIEGMDEIRRLQLVVENFNQYKRVAGSMIPKNDRADQYIEEATRLIQELRQQKENEMKQPSTDDEFGEEDASESDEESTEQPEEPLVEPIEPEESPAPDDSPAPVEPAEPEELPAPDDTPAPVEPAEPEKLPTPDDSPAPVDPVEPEESPAPDDLPVPVEPEEEPLIEPIEPEPSEEPIPEESPEPEDPEEVPEPDEIPVPDEG